MTDDHFEVAAMGVPGAMPIGPNQPDSADQIDPPGSRTPDGRPEAGVSGRSERIGDKVWAAIELPKIDPFVAPILYAVPVQLLAYHVAVVKGSDVDQPRNLAKSVTVE